MQQGYERRVDVVDQCTDEQNIYWEAPGQTITGEPSEPYHNAGGLEYLHHFSVQRDQIIYLTIRRRLGEVEDGL